MILGPISIYPQTYSVWQGIDSLYHRIQWSQLYHPKMFRNCLGKLDRPSEQSSIRSNIFDGIGGGCYITSTVPDSAGHILILTWFETCHADSASFSDTYFRKLLPNSGLNYPISYQKFSFSSPLLDFFQKDCSNPVRGVQNQGKKSKSHPNQHEPAQHVSESQNDKPDRLQPYFDSCLRESQSTSIDQKQAMFPHTNTL